MYEAELPRCSAVVATGEILNYQFEGARSSRAALRRLFKRVHAALAPGGAFIFDIATHERAPKDGPRVYWKEVAIGACTRQQPRPRAMG